MLKCRLVVNSDPEVGWRCKILHWRIHPVYRCPNNIHIILIFISWVSPAAMVASGEREGGPGSTGWGLLSECSRFGDLLPIHPFFVMWAVDGMRTREKSSRSIKSMSLHSDLLSPQGVVSTMQDLKLKCGLSKSSVLHLKSVLATDVEVIGRVGTVPSSWSRLRVYIV